MRMPHLVWVAYLYILVGCATKLPLPPANTEEPAIRTALDHYLRGHATGQGAAFSEVFHPSARLLWVRGDTLAIRTAAQYIAGATGKPADDEAQRKRFTASVWQAGNAAMGKIILDYPNAKFADYMAMLKLDGKWQILNKSFHVQPVTAPPAPSGEEPAIRAIIEQYFEANKTGNAALIRAAFHPTAQLFWVGTNGTLKQLDRETFASGYTGKAEPVLKQTLARLDVTGTNAVAQVVLEYPKNRYTDFLTLLRIRGKWVIINKVFISTSK